MMNLSRVNKTGFSDLGGWQRILQSNSEEILESITVCLQATLVYKLSRLTIHLLDGHLGVSNHNISLSQEPASHRRIGVHNISKFNLFLAELFLKIIKINNMRMKSTRVDKNLQYSVLQ